MSKELPIRLHGIFPYDRSAKARWLLTEVGAKFENRWMDLEKREFEQGDYLKLNPMGRVPVLEHGDSPVFESGAICAYLADLHIDQGMAPALQDPLRARYQQWMYFAAATLDPMQTRIMVIEDIPASEYKTTKETALIEELDDAMTTLDQTLAKSPFLVGDRFTAADICVSYHLTWLRLWPELDAKIKPHARVLAYLDRMQARPAARQADVFSYEG